MKSIITLQVNYEYALMMPFMEFKFFSKYLQDLYEKGYSRKFKFMTMDLCKKFVTCISRIDAAVTIYDLRIPPSMRFEALEGYENRFSIRMDKKYRIEFEIKFSDKEKTVGVVEIVNVSKHYE